MVFKSIRNSLSGSVATWAFSGHAHYAAQDHPVYIPRTRPPCVLPQVALIRPRTVREKVGQTESGSIAAMKESDTMSNRAGAGGEQSEAADQRRAQILQAAIDVISERGYADTRIADVGSGFGEADRVRGD